MEGSDVQSTHTRRNNTQLNLAIYIVAALALLAIFDALDAIDLSSGAWMSIGLLAVLTVVFILYSLHEQYGNSSERILSQFGFESDSSLPAEQLMTPKPAPANRSKNAVDAARVVEQPPSVV